MGFDHSCRKRIRFDETSSEAMKETIEPFFWNRSCRHMPDHIIESDEDRDLDNHHQTSLERALSVGLEHLHRFCGQFFRIVLIFFLDFSKLWLKRSHAFLHIVPCQGLFDHK